MVGKLVASSTKRPYIQRLNMKVGPGWKHALYLVVEHSEVCLSSQVSEINNLTRLVLGAYKLSQSKENRSPKMP